jgi:hypothetical protein
MLISIITGKLMWIDYYKLWIFYFIIYTEPGEFMPGFEIYVALKFR